MKQQTATVEACSRQASVSCHNCRLGSLCLPLALEQNDIIKLDEIIERGKPLQRGDHLYRQDTPFRSVYAVRSGSMKTYRLTDQGEEQVMGFYFPGEIIGMDGISKDRYTSNAIALETAAVCEIPFSRLGELSTQLPSLQRHFFQLMSQEIVADQWQITLLSKKSAEQRLAALLLGISDRNNLQKLSSTQFRLSMSRADIANYLGLTVETVSRLFSRLSKREIIAVNQKEITLLDVECLRAMCDGRDSAA